MKYIFFISLLLVLGKHVRAQPKEDWIDVYFISNDDDTLHGYCKESYYYENSFSSFGYYDQEQKRQRVHAEDYKKILMKDVYLESVLLKSTVKKDCDKRVFFKRLIDGPMIMYHFHYVKPGYGGSKCLEEIYIRKRDEECAYPIYKEACEHEVVFVSQPKNYNDMIRIFEDTPEIIEKIESGEYRREDFEAIVLEYNQIISDRQ